MTTDYSRYETLRIEQDGRILTVTMNNPEQLNCTTEKMHWELSRVFIDTADDGDADVIVLTGAGRDLIGYMRAKQYLLSGDAISAPEAAAIGLINFSVPAEALDETVARWAQRYAKGARRSIQWTKATINTGLKQIASTVLDTGFAYEGMSNHTEDHREAVDAFLAKRKPSFSGN